MRFPVRAFGSTIMLLGVTTLIVCKAIPSFESVGPDQTFTRSSAVARTPVMTTGSIASMCCASPSFAVSRSPMHDVLEKRQERCARRARLGDLSPTDLAAFCDWEACIRANGYAHACSINDAGWEACHVCDDPSSCSGNFMSEGDCAAHATDADRGACHVGLLEECLLQQAMRGPAFSCVAKNLQKCASVCWPAVGRPLR